MKAPRWDVEGRDWPNRAASRFVEAAGYRWHVQVMGQGPVMLMLHGSGAATHSWAGLAPLLAKHFTLVAPDLPGHGFTAMPPGFRLGLPDMARDVRVLLKALDLTPAYVVAHSAGAAVAIRMTLDAAISPRAIVAINGALKPFPGAAGTLFPALAKLLFVNPLVPSLVAWRAGDTRAIERLIKGTGSHLDAKAADFYARLIRTPAHVEGALGMMANWNLAPLVADLPRLSCPLTLIVGMGDTAVPPDVADGVKARLPSARIERLAGLGHLAHEERPDLVGQIILRVAGAGLAAAG
jgi:magnesium chelatase accessory protein